MFRARTFFFIYCDYVLFFLLFVNIPSVCAWIWSFTYEFMHNINQYGCLFIYVHHTPMHYINIVTKNKPYCWFKDCPKCQPMIQINDEKYKSLQKHTNHHENIQIITETFNSSKNHTNYQQRTMVTFFLSQKMLRFGFFYAFCRCINITRQMSLNKLIYWGWGITLRIKSFK